MKKSAGIAAGALVAIAALGAGGAWYTGNQLPTVLDESIKQANADLAKSLPALGLNASIELLSLERGLFSSNARYRLTFDGALDGEAPQQVALVIGDRIEHGPFPLSRVKTLRLMPVLATSNYTLESSPALDKWFAAASGESPLHGQVSLGYDRSVVGSLSLSPLQMALDDESSLDFSGLDIDFDSTAEAKAIVASGLMDSLKISTRLSESQDPLTIELQGMTLDSQTEKGASDFYLGRNQVKLQGAQILVGDNPPILLKDIAQLDETSEADGRLAGRSTYSIGMVSYQGHDIGGLEMISSVKNLDAGALQSLLALYGELLGGASQAQAQPASLAAESDMPELSEAQQAQLMVDLDRLLDAKPSVALEKLALKTANGESSLSLALDFAKPASFELPAPELAKQLISQLDARLVVSKAMITDVVGLQATLAGETDQQAVAQSAAMMTEMTTGMALASELALLEDDNIVTRLRYADDMVDFNGKQMTVEQFLAMALNSGAGLGMGAGAAAEEEFTLESEEDAGLEAEMPVE